MKVSCGLQQLTGELAPQGVEVEIADTGAPTGVPPRRLDAPDPLPHRQSRQVLHQMRL